VRGTIIVKAGARFTGATATRDDQERNPMAKTLYFAADAVELSSMYPMNNREFAAKFPGVKGRRSDSFSMWVGETADRAVLPVERWI
jgi:hypothetical protein